MSHERTPVEQLWCSAVDVKPIDFDWSEGYGERWDTIQPDPNQMDLATCKRFLEHLGRDLPEPNPWALDRPGLLELIEAEPDEFVEEDWTVEEIRQEAMELIDAETIDGIEEWREDVRDAYVPMMNYIYPLPGYDDDQASNDQLLLHLEGGPVCLVQVDGEIYLALTGGGMDLSWSLVEAYMLLGYLPPLHFSAKLPRMAGMTLNEKTRWILEGCRRTAEVARRWAENALEEVDRTLNWLQAEAANR